MKNYYEQQLILLDSISATLDDMLQLAKYQPLGLVTDDIEVQLLQVHGREMTQAVQSKMRMLGLL